MQPYVDIANQTQRGTLAVEIRNLSFQYKNQKDGLALNSLDLLINKGEFVVIMGPSGAGKSTLAHCLNGLIPNFVRGKYNGNVTVWSKNPAKEKVGTMAKEIGLVFQDFEAQLFSTNVRLEIVFGPENFNFPVDRMKDLLQKIIKVANLEGLEDRQPATLSGGQKQRLAIGSVLAIEPRILCMDEPTTDLDPIGKMGVFEIAGQLQRDGEMTLIIIEHETEETLKADRIIVMNQGKIVRDGKPEAVLREVDFFASLGIIPLQIPQFFSLLGVSREELPLTPAEGVRKFTNLNWEVDQGKYAAVVAGDIAREEKYGKVIISVSGLEHAYSTGNKVLKGIDLEIREGEFIAILGHNGSGKTTLVKHFNGLLQPTSGQIRVNGKENGTHSIFEIGKDVGYVFQNPDHQIFSDTVYDEVAFSPRMRGFSPEETRQLVQEALQAVDMTGYERQDPFALTKGERQRVAVASILSAKPKIIILDEPTTGLDYKEQRQMMELIKRLNNNGHTIIIVTHTMWVVAEYVHRVAVMNDGLITLCGGTREVFQKEAELAKSYLKVPHIVEFSNRLGTTVLAVEEMLACTVRGGDQNGNILVSR